MKRAVPIIFCQFCFWFVCFFKSSWKILIGNLSREQETLSISDFVICLHLSGLVVISLEPICTVPDSRPLDTYLDVEFLKIVNARESVIVVEELLVSVLIINKVTQTVFYSAIIIKILLSRIQSLWYKFLQCEVIIIGFHVEFAAESNYFISHLVLLFHFILNFLIKLL